MSAQIFIKLLNGKTMTVPGVNLETDTVLNLKEKIEEREGVNIDQQRLVYAGKQLEDDKVLSFYSMPDEATIHLVLRLR